MVGRWTSSCVHAARHSVVARASSKAQQKRQDQDPAHPQPRAVLKRAAARSANQQKYLDALEDADAKVVVAHGPAGTGKTRLAVSVGLRKLLMREDGVQKLILVRPTIAVEEEQHGFLPGTLADKIRPWLIPVLDAAAEYVSVSSSTTSSSTTSSSTTSSSDVRRGNELVTSLMKESLIEFAPFSHMRGRTFSNSWIVCDEAQNCTSTQLLLLLTRLGENSKAVVNGDLQQTDLQQHIEALRQGKVTGLQDLIARIERQARARGPGELSADSALYSCRSALRSVELSASDVQRSRVVQEVLALYNDNDDPCVR